MSAETALALLLLAGMLAYAALGGADFGGGIWDLLAWGSRRTAQKEAIATAMGPVWEANHVWLIFVIVLLFAGFPAAYAALSIGLFWPFHLALLGIVLRGASFIFRSYGRAPEGMPDVWPRLFGIASVVTPFAFGTCLGAVSTGSRGFRAGHAWLEPFALATGVLALSLCAYLAAVYLCAETAGGVRGDFRRRALGMWCVAGAASVLTLLLAAAYAPRLLVELLQWPAVLIVGAGAALAPASGYTLLVGRYALARVLAAAQVVLLLAGWAAAQWPYLVYPDVTIQAAAAPEPALQALLWTAPFGLGILLPSLWFLFSVFKGGLAGTESR